MKKAFGFSIAASMVIGGAASAGVIIYDNPLADIPGSAVNQEFGDFPDFSTYLVADMAIPDLGGGGTTLTSIIMPMTLQPLWAGITTARLHVFAKTGALPVGGDNPTASVIVAVSYDVNTGILSTVGLDMDVAAGDYWIGLTAIGDFGVKGQAFAQEGANAAGDPDAAINPGGGFAFPAGTDWFSILSYVEWEWHSFAMTVEGVAIPAPGALALLGVAGFVTRRRRRG